MRTFIYSNHKKNITMETSFNYRKIILFSAVFFCALFNAQTEAMQAAASPISVSDAKQEFRNFRVAMGYIDSAGRASDNSSGYFDISVQTLATLVEEARNNGWTSVRIYNGLDARNNQSLLMSGLRMRGSQIEESSKSSNTIIKVENSVVAPGSNCPRWCDVAGTAIGK
ncbi:hypothetical protein CBW16_08790 [Flavobacteriaceae bacterium JJC]|nr:hypothetical protein CBW16_08790 [Flavobacteriaceae bacterium JJC]